MAKQTVKSKPNTKPQAAVAEKPKAVEKAKPVEKPKAVEKPKTPEKARPAEKAKQPNAIVRWWRETLGELRKVTWPTPEEAWRLTKIVLVTMFAMSVVLGLLDFLFSWLIRLILS
ncbi:preprotein translocase subunit SecE [Thermanaerothrix sp.]|uniref:preprotein translocase subunit SecE n=1 Tax=Thermanaerothrix sp. TaxID=2972675 RepID=UPI002ADD92D9|nr:preprotein translocase subunit SecE [Thermanaerothrix sp.]